MNEDMMSFQEWLKILLRSLLISVSASVLCYRSAWGMLLEPAFFVWEYVRTRKKILEYRKKQLEEQFMHGMQVLNSALQAGLSMENAWREVEKETKFLYGEETLFYREIRNMNHSVGLNMPIEKLFLDFAYRSGIEEAIRFAEVLDYGKRCGGNWNYMIDTVVSRMGDKYDAWKEIEVMVAEKKMEQQVMNLMPLGILLFLQISAWDYLSVLYHNWLGVIGMSIFLGGYMASLWLSEKILQIRV